MESHSLENSKINFQYQNLELKIANKVIACNLQKTIQGTMKFTAQKETNFIQDIEIKEQKLHQRIFYKNEPKNTVGYIEVFQNSFLSYAHELSENISFLFECNSQDNKRINSDKCFGFRYYDSNNNYCTLLKLNDENEDDYFILEKLEKIENKFYDKDLDCFKIIFDSIFSRYKKLIRDKNHFDFQLIMERPLYEILGFSYSILSRKNSKFKFHKIHTINLMKDIDFTSHIGKEEGEEILNIMPILFDGHISVLFFYDEKGKRNFILSDVSQIHCRLNGNSVTINPFIFSENIRKNLEVYPKRKIQAFNSCSLWYYFQILCLINYNEKIQTKKYIDIKSFIDSIKNSSFYLDCFNYYQYIMGFEKKLIEVNPEKTFDEEDYFYLESKNTNFSIKIHKFCFLNQFLNFNGFIELISGYNLTYFSGLNELNMFRTLNEELIDFILYLNYNINLLEVNAKKDIDVIISLKRQNEMLVNKRKIFVDSCDEFLSGLIKIDNSTKNLERYYSAEAKKFEFDGKYLYEIYKEIKMNFKDFQELKDNIEKEYDLYPLDITSKILFPIVGFLYKSK